MTTLINLCDITPPAMVEGIKEGALEYWINHNYLVAQGIKKSVEWLDEEEEEFVGDTSPQYKKKCDNDCGIILSISTAIMCWSKGEEEKTLCNECYWDGGFYKDDDNEEEIKDYIVEKNCPCYGECCDEYHLEKDCSCIISTPVE